jgi:hypothetical protein
MNKKPQLYEDNLFLLDEKLYEQQIDQMTEQFYFQLENRFITPLFSRLDDYSFQDYNNKYE